MRELLLWTIIQRGLNKNSLCFVASVQLFFFFIRSSGSVRWEVLRWNEEKKRLCSNICVIIKTQSKAQELSKKREQTNWNAQNMIHRMNLIRSVWHPRVRCVTDAGTPAANSNHLCCFPRGHRDGRRDLDWGSWQHPPIFFFFFPPEAREHC